MRRSFFEGAASLLPLFAGGDGSCSDEFCFNCVINMESHIERTAALKKFFHQLPGAPPARVYKNLVAWNEDIDPVHPSRHFLHFEEVVDCGLFECLAKILIKANNKKWESSLRDQEQHIVYQALLLVAAYCRSVEFFAHKAVKAGLVPLIHGFALGSRSFLEQKSGLAALAALARYPTSAEALLSGRDRLPRDVLRIAEQAFEKAYSDYVRVPAKRQRWQSLLLAHCPVSRAEAVSERRELLLPEHERGVDALDWASDTRFFALLLLERLVRYSSAVLVDVIPAVAQLVTHLRESIHLSTRLVVAALFAHLALLPSGREQLLSAGAVPQLGEMLRVGPERARSMALTALLRLLHDPSLHNRVASAAHYALMDMLEAGALWGDLGSAPVGPRVAAALLAAADEGVAEGGSFAAAMATGSAETIVARKQQESAQSKEWREAQLAEAFKLRLEAMTMANEDDPDFMLATERLREALDICPLAERVERQNIYHKLAYVLLQTQDAPGAVSAATRALLMFDDFGELADYDERARHNTSLAKDREYWTERAQLAEKTLLVRAEAYEKLNQLREAALDAEARSRREQEGSESGPMSLGEVFEELPALRRVLRHAYGLLDNPLPTLASRLGAMQTDTPLTSVLLQQPKEIWDSGGVEHSRIFARTPLATAEHDLLDNEKYYLDWQYDAPDNTLLQQRQLQPDAFRRMLRVGQSFYPGDPHDMPNYLGAFRSQNHARSMPLSDIDPSDEGEDADEEEDEDDEADDGFHAAHGHLEFALPGGAQGLQGLLMQMLNGAQMNPPSGAQWFPEPRNRPRGSGSTRQPPRAAPQASAAAPSPAPAPAPASASTSSNPRGPSASSTPAAAPSLLAQAAARQRENVALVDDADEDDRSWPPRLSRPAAANGTARAADPEQDMPPLTEFDSEDE